MKRPNGSGGVRKLSGKRRKPYQAVITDGLRWDGAKFVQNQVSLGVYKTKKEALEALAAYQLNPTDLEGRDLTFTQVYDLIKEDFKESMKIPMRTAFRQVAPVLEKKRIGDIRKKDLDLVAQLLAEKSGSSQNNAKLLISRIFRYGMENDYIQKDYSQYMVFPKTAPKREKKAFAPEEIRQLLQMDEYFPVMLYTGMRPSELVEMKSRSVYEENGVLCFHVEHSKTKAGIRTIPVHSQIMDLLTLDKEYAVTPHRSYNKVSYDFKAFLDHSDFTPGHSLHDLRRTFSTYAKSCGMDEFSRRALMGHAQQGITDLVYTDALVPDLKKEIEKLHYAEV